MTIDTLPASPAGEIDHIDVRLKINEIVDFVNQPYINVRSLRIQQIVMLWWGQAIPICTPLRRLSLSWAEIMRVMFKQGILKTTIAI